MRTDRYLIRYTDGTAATIEARTPAHARQLGYRLAGSRIILDVHTARI
jgi:hypothetical protein